MKNRFTLGLVLLFLLAVFCLWAGREMNRIFTPMSREFSQAADLALAGNLENARHLARSGSVRWYARRVFISCLADQTPADEAQQLLSQLDVFASPEERAHFAACCRELSALCRAMADAHSLRLFF